MDFIKKAAVQIKTLALSTLFKKEGLITCDNPFLLNIIPLKITRQGECYCFSKKYLYSLLT